MSEPRRIFVAAFEPADTIFVDGADPIALKIDEATRRLDRMREEDERVRLAALADIERAKATRRARAARRFKRALKIFRRS
jgi:hypothetical protein